MGMSTYVIGFRPPDDKWRKMKAVWDACKAAGTNPPTEVDRFFGGEPPDESGIKIELRERDYVPCVKRYSTDAQEGFEVDIQELLKLHPQITHIRFVNSY